MKVIGRKHEIRQLEEYQQSQRPEFIALYGRRRVGKTFLIDTFFKNKFTFNISGVIDGKRSEQMAVFVQGLRSLGYHGEMPKTWLDAFYLLSQQLEPLLVQNQRCIIFIDELPCFDTPKSGFIRALGHFWNSWAVKHDQIMLIVCGSATSWMINNIIDNHGGLHNRITHEMHISPFSLYETEQFLLEKNVVLDRLAIMQLYMALGGIPYYLDMINAGESASTAIDRIFFSSNNTMGDEYQRLFSSLFRDPAPYLQIIDILSKCRQGVTRDQIIEALGKHDNGHISEYLTNLIKCDFVRYYFVKTTKVKKTDGFYQLTDFFVIFHNTFLHKPVNDQHFWSNMQSSSLQNIWFGLAFERICMAHIEQIKHALGIDRIGTQYYSWRSKQSVQGAQIDLIIERADRIINLCEIKYSANEYRLSKDEDIKMRNRQSDFTDETGTRFAIHPVFITTYGLRKSEYSGGIVAEVTMDDLFKNL